MSDYSNIKFERVDDLPAKYLSRTKLSKPLSPASIYQSLPFLKGLEIGETVKFQIPEDGFEYKINRSVPNDSTRHYGALKAAMGRTFAILAKEQGVHYVFRIVANDIYIKRVDG